MYVSVLSVCFICDRPFRFNPLRVPAMLVTRQEDGSYVTDPSGEKRPYCSTCLEEVVNPQLEAQGLSPWLPRPDAYEPVEESELRAAGW